MGGIQHGCSDHQNLCLTFSSCLHSPAIKYNLKASTATCLSTWTVLQAQPAFPTAHQMSKPRGVPFGSNPSQTTFQTFQVCSEKSMVPDFPVLSSTLPQLHQSSVLYLRKFTLMLSLTRFHFPQNPLLHLHWHSNFWITESLETSPDLS